MGCRNWSRFGARGRGRPRHHSSWDQTVVNFYSCMDDDVRMVDDCKQGTPTGNKHVNDDFQMSTFHKFESAISIIQHVSLTMMSGQSSSPIGGEGNSPNYARLIVVEYIINNLAKNDLDVVMPAGIFMRAPGPRLNIKPSFPGMGILMLKIRRSRYRLIFNMGIPILVRHLFIDTAPRRVRNISVTANSMCCQIKGFSNNIVQPSYHLT